MSWRVTFFGTPDGEQVSPLRFATRPEADRYGFGTMLDGMPADGYRVEEIQLGANAVMVMPEQEVQ